MALGPKTKTLGGSEFTLGLLPTSVCLDFMTRLAKVVGPMLMGQASQDTDAGGRAVAQLFSAIQPKELDALVKVLLGTCLIDGKPLFGPTGGVYDIAFQGNLSLLFQVVGWALQENLGDFSGLLAQVRTRVQSLTADKLASGSLGLGGTGTSSPSGPSTA